jgi:hypothetical protein
MAIVGAVTDDRSAVERSRPRTGRELGSVSALVSYWSRRLLNSLLAGRGPIPSWLGKTFLPNPRVASGT